VRASTALPALLIPLVLLGACSTSSPGEGSPGNGGARDGAAPSDASSGQGHDATGEPSHDAAAADGEAVGDSAGPTGDAGDAGDAQAPSICSGGEQPDAGDDCAYGGAPGTCISVSACAAMSGYTSFAGYCPGPASVECCVVTPSTTANPPFPAGWMLMQQSQVTSAMTTWAVMILDEPAMCPMFSTATMTFGTLLVLARVEWHPPDFNNSAIHRGVTLYEPTD